MSTRQEGLRQAQVRRGGDVLSNAATVYADGIATGTVQLSTLSAAAYSEGTLAWVKSVGAAFRLQQVALTVDPLTVVAASGLSGYQWVRVNQHNAVWEAQTTWWVDPQNLSGTASDENSGIDNTHQLRSYKELSRRLHLATFSTAYTFNVNSNLQAGDTPAFTIRTSPGGTITFQGVPSVIYTGTITTWTSESATAAADDNELNDASVPVSFTASGVLADGILLKRTNGTAIYWYAMKDLGGRTIRCSNPCDLNAVLTTPAAGDTYQALSLPTIGALRFPLLSFDQGPTYRFVNHVDSTSPLGGSAISYSHSWRTGGLSGFISSSTNLAVNASAISYSGRHAFPIGLTAGMFRSSAGNTVWAISCIIAPNRVCVQGGGLRFDLGGGFSSSARTTVCDSTTTCLLASTGGSSVGLVSPGCLGGLGNTGKLAGTEKGGRLTYTTATPFNGACTSDASPIVLQGTSYTIASLPASPVELSGVTRYP